MSLPPRDSAAVVPIPTDGPLPDLPARIEGLLFVASEPATLAQLAQTLQANEAAVEEAVEQLRLHYQQRGLRLQRNGRRVQLVTAPEMAADVERFLGLEATTRLSGAALETLALIAYRQPITRAQMEATRGVNCDGVLKTLLGHGLVEPVGRLEQAGRPVIFGTTFQFLQHFGLADLGQLPSLEELTPPQEGQEANEPGRTTDQTT